jgi:hypothetical protein
MGTVIIGGLTSSLFLTLFLVPVVYLFVIGWVERIGRKLRARRARRAAQDAADDADGEVPASPAEQPQPVLR